jgi:hypothetical protein
MKVNGDYGGAGTVFVLAGGVLAPVDVARAADERLGVAYSGVSSEASG